jgi:plastocyanin
MPIHTYADNGVYEVCVVMVVTVENVISCISDYCTTVVVEGLQEDDCPGQIWSGVGESCATMNFEIGSFVEGESVTWFPGDESGAVQGGHFFSHTYENPGLYTVCAFYTSPLCPDGVELCTNIFVESCGNECPNEIFASQIDCDSFLFQIPGNEGEVNWNFGDNTEENSSNSADHTYLQDGVYVITAHYTSPGCNEGITLVATVEVNCGNDCTSFILPNYNCQQGTTTLTVVGINENANTTWWWGNNEVNTESSSIIIENTGDWIFVCAWSEAMQLDGCPEVCDEIYVGCENACSLNVDILQESCEVLVLSAAGVPNPENVMWSLNGENFNLGSITTFPLSPGANQICAWYEGELCSDEWCETFQGCNGLDCPDEIWSGADVECGVMNFEIGSFVEGESVNWFPGDDTGVVEGGHFFSHTYAEPGTYLVCAVYTSPNCEGVELCTTIVVEECGECSEVSFSLDSFVGEEGPGLVTWSLSNSDGLVLYEGMNEYSLQDPWYDQALCLENGCYTFNICSSQPFAAEAFGRAFF